MREIWSKSNAIKDTKFSASYNDNGASHTDFDSVCYSAKDDKEGEDKRGTIRNYSRHEHWTGIRF